MKKIASDTPDTLIVPTVFFTITQAGRDHLRRRAERSQETEQEPDFSECTSLPSIANGGSRYSDL